MSSTIRDEAFGMIPIWLAPANEGEPTGDAYRVLLIQHHAGHWSFPKGHADPGETAIATACREFEEETGITNYTVLDGGETSFTEHYTFTQWGKTVEKTVTYFPALVNSHQVTVQADEIQNYDWLNYEAALERITFEQARLLLQRVNAYLVARSAN
ncbi:bis(5'-nucleosyl)-tetraphosphatase [Leptolyngbya sp. AN02str]|uniref:bis(5'-nucleosyl)-tetraphosphatase n=1 Tax=Leptolyngbya sp. AN02str TaxID=3423363 RepID=UPI003D320C5E